MSKIVFFSLAFLLLAPLAPSSESLPENWMERLTPAQRRSQFPPHYFLPSVPGEHRLQIGDEVEVSVFGHRDTVSDAIPIAPDGKLYYRFLPGIPAEGRRPDEVAREIESQIGHLFSNPEVSILPVRFSANSFSIFGKVQTGGVYPLEKPTTIRQAIAMANGIPLGKYGDTAILIHNFQDSWILRDGKRLPVDFEALMNQEDSSQDIYVRPGDVIYIASALGREVYLMGEVRKQQSQPFTDGMTLVQLITGIEAGTDPDPDAADLRRVIILRDAMTDPKVFRVNLHDIVRGKAHDVFLEPGDIVYVPEKSFLFTRNLVKSMIVTFANTFASKFAGDITAEYLAPNL